MGHLQWSNSMKAKKEWQQTQLTSIPHCCLLHSFILNIATSPSLPWKRCRDDGWNWRQACTRLFGDPALNPWQGSGSLPWTVARTATGQGTAWVHCLGRGSFKWEKGTRSAQDLQLMQESPPPPQKKQSGMSEAGTWWSDTTRSAFVLIMGHSTRPMPTLRQSHTFPSLAGPHTQSTPKGSLLWGESTHIYSELAQDQWDQYSSDWALRWSLGDCPIGLSSLLYLWKNRIYPMSNPFRLCHKLFQLFHNTWKYQNFKIPDVLLQFFLEWCLPG